MKIEEKIKKLTIEISLHRMLKNGIKNPGRAARNAIELAETILHFELEEREEQELMERLAAVLQKERPEEAGILIDAYFQDRRENR